MSGENGQMTRAGMVEVFQGGAKHPFPGMCLRLRDSGRLESVGAPNECIFS